ncbi:bifunctional diguanylate cyclase/phosphodiesterase [Quadrisphaera sp. INWT6]|nr:bifunctional diguanylate cyclase/phosphodiesterase [Quadrisphaera sp. INWT6]
MDPMVALAIKVHDGATDASTMPRALVNASRVSARTKTATTGCLYLTGGAAGALTTAAVWGAPRPATVVLLVLTLLAVLTGASLLTWGHRAPQWVIHVVVASGSFLIATAVVLSHDDTAAMGVATVFALCAIGILYFFGRRQSQLHAAVQLAAVVVSLTWRGFHPGVVGAVVLVQLAVVVTVGRLVTRAADSVLDSLTGLPNRRGFDEHLERASATAHRTGGPLALALIDVDHFKAVNDRGGHVAGDALLQHLAARWAGLVPAGARLSRYGGDEYAVVASGPSAAGLVELCDQLRGAAAPTSVSAGVAELSAGESCASLVRRADAALYAAKAAGRACTRTAAPDDDALAVELAAAIAGGALDVVLQPVVRPASREVVGFESLVRWDHPERGQVPPGCFVPLAERTGQVAALGRLVLERACRDAGLLRAAVGREVLLTVNASGHQLVDAGFVDEVAAVLVDTGWPAEQLVVEVTESTVEIASTQALRTLAQLRELGVAVAIDDFGTGYSAFSHLDTLPADYLKLDAAFTAQITTSSRRAAMLSALLDLADQLGLVVIAEGVESAEHANLLSLLGCPLAQGYFYARPAGVHDLLRRPADAGSLPRPVSALVSSAGG